MFDTLDHAINAISLFVNHQKWLTFFLVFTPPTLHSESVKIRSSQSDRNKKFGAPQARWVDMVVQHFFRNSSQEHFQKTVVVTSKLKVLNCYFDPLAGHRPTAGHETNPSQIRPNDAFETSFGRLLMSLRHHLVGFFGYNEQFHVSETSFERLLRL